MDSTCTVFNYWDSSFQTRPSLHLEQPNQRQKETALRDSQTSRHRSSRASSRRRGWIHGDFCIPHTIKTASGAHDNVVDGQGSTSEHHLPSTGGPYTDRPSTWGFRALPSQTNSQPPQTCSSTDYLGTLGSQGSGLRLRLSLILGYSLVTMECALGSLDFLCIFYLPELCRRIYCRGVKGWDSSAILGCCDGIGIL